jgi:hypothetical protein
MTPGPFNLDIDLKISPSVHFSPSVQLCRSSKGPLVAKTKEAAVLKLKAGLDRWLEPESPRKEAWPGRRSGAIGD